MINEEQFGSWWWSTFHYLKSRTEGQDLLRFWVLGYGKIRRKIKKFGGCLKDRYPDEYHAKPTCSTVKVNVSWYDTLALGACSFIPSIRCSGLFTRTEK